MTAFGESLIRVHSDADLSWQWMMQGWEIPKELVNIKEYMAHIAERESWKQTFYVRFKSAHLSNL